MKLSCLKRAGWGREGYFLCEIRDSDEFFSKSKSNWEVVKKYFSNKRKSIREQMVKESLVTYLLDVNGESILSDIFIRC